jgi:glycosyltransferase involved in cell wall biosynthesis
VTTLHTRLDLPEVQALHREFAEAPVVSISNAQRRPLANANWVATVRNDTAIRIALRAGRGPGVEFPGQVGGHDKDVFLREAAALLFPMRWPEPFGLVMAEALACGTPVLALNCGSVPEVLRDGHTGFIRDAEDQLVEAVQQIPPIDGRAVL